MTLVAIGAGFGRTGTASLKAALERRGCAPCCHMPAVVAPAAEAIRARCGGAS